MRTTRWALLAAVALCVLPGTAGAALDRSFSGDGIARIADFPGTTHARGAAIAVQPDGKIVVGGAAVLAGDDFAVMRFLPNGALDPTFGGDGIVTTEFSTDDDAVQALGLQPDGKIVAVGVESGATGGSDIAIARYLSNGNPDPTFDDDGRRIFAFANGSAADYASGLAFQPGGKILVGATFDDGPDNDLLLVRFESNGELDDGSGNDPVPGDSFGTGYQEIDPGGDNDLYRMIQQPDGKVILASEIQNGPDDNIPVLLRYNADGSADDGAAGDATPGDAFGLGGTIQVDFDLVDDGHDFPTGLALAPGGKILMSAAAERNDAAGAEYHWAVARLTSAGTIDLSGPPPFGGDGRVTFTVGAGGGTLNQASDVRVQADGKVVLGGHGFSAASSGGPAAVRLRTDGSFDSTFGGDGIAFADILPGQPDTTRSIALAGGRVLLAGFAIPAPGQADPTLVAFAQFDVDDDGRRDGVDNCPGKPNPAQLDKDKDGRGDVCDPVDNGVPSPGNDTLIGTPAADKLNGLAGNDTIRGLGSADELIGGKGKDRLFGAGGGDTLRGGNGKDTFRGGKGNDRIRAADGTKESIRCGAGKDDRATVDDNDEVAGCEKVTRKD